MDSIQYILFSNYPATDQVFQKNGRSLLRSGPTDSTENTTRSDVNCLCLLSMAQCSSIGGSPSCVQLPSQTQSHCLPGHGGSATLGLPPSSALNNLPLFAHMHPRRGLPRTTSGRTPAMVCPTMYHDREIQGPWRHLVSRLMKVLGEYPRAKCCLIWINAPLRKCLSNNISPASYELH